jgi:hypothetical protein
MSRKKSANTPFTLLSGPVWRAREAAHRARAERHTRPARSRRDRGEPHPIADFLFDYYPYSFSFLETWHPGIGTGLEWEAANPPQSPFTARWYAQSGGFLFADSARLEEKEKQRFSWILELLSATRGRAPNFACHGLHEWAMVYRGREIRHEQTLRLRLPQTMIDELVETRTICCSHHDAFRFFAAEARPFNRLQPDLESRVILEQPGCVHANMDLYKWAAKTMPWTGSDLLLDCFELAAELRDLDMRASPYDLKEWGYEAVCIETIDGRRAYEREQKHLADKAAVLRDLLIASIRRTLESGLEA